MVSVTNEEIIQLMGLLIFLMGIFTFMLGLFLLVIRTFGRNVSQVADQTQKMVQKGVADDIAGLVGNATALLEAMQGMIKSTRSVSIFITLLGCGMMAAGYLLISQQIFPA